MLRDSRPPLGLKLLVTLALGLLVMAAVLLLTGNDTARAQCGADASTCMNCHQGEEAYPVKELGAWHIDHAANDFCQLCHGGDKESKDHVTAHATLFDPLSERAAARCTTCHPGDAQAKFDSYVTLAATFDAAASAGAAPETLAAAAPGDPGYDTRNIALAGFAGALTVLSGVLVWNMEDLGARLRHKE